MVKQQAGAWHEVLADVRSVDRQGPPRPHDRAEALHVEPLARRGGAHEQDGKEQWAHEAHGGRIALRPGRIKLYGGDPPSSETRHVSYTAGGPWTSRTNDDGLFTTSR